MNDHHTRVKIASARIRDKNLVEILAVNSCRDGFRIAHGIIDPYEITDKTEREQFFAKYGIYEPKPKTPESLKVGFYTDVAIAMLDLYPERYEQEKTYHSFFDAVDAYTEMLNLSKMEIPD